MLGLCDEDRHHTTPPLLGRKRLPTSPGAVASVSAPLRAPRTQDAPPFLIDPNCRSLVGEEQAKTSTGQSPVGGNASSLSYSTPRRDARLLRAGTPRRPEAGSSAEARP